MPWTNILQSSALLTVENRSSTGAAEFSSMENSSVSYTTVSADMEASLTYSMGAVWPIISIATKAMVAAATPRPSEDLLPVFIVSGPLLVIIVFVVVELLSLVEVVVVPASSSAGPHGEAEPAD